MTLSPEQRACITARGQDVCVVAGPGSGKTLVLIERFRWLVETEGIDPRRILAITFTEKAATEIKTRLVDAFAHRPELRIEIERAWVSTVHGFCARLLRDHAILAGVDPEFVVLDENETDAGLEEVAVETLDRLLAEDGDRLRELLARLHVSSNPEGRQPDLAQALIEVYEAMRVAGRSPAELAAPPPPDLGMEDVLRAVRELLASDVYGRTEAQQRRRGQLHAWLQETDGADPFRALARIPCDLRGQKGTAYHALMTELVPEARAAMIARRNAAEYEVLIDAIRRIDVAWREHKRRMGALDFADLEEAAIRLLSDQPELAARVRGGFDAILMDELQDTNPLQWRLVDLLRRPERFFAVGDVNQSIFGFRHAEPAVFRRFRDSVAAAGKPVHELRENHRSRPGILGAVNAVFAAADGVEPHTLFPEGEPAVEVFAAEAPTTAEARQVEAAWIARRILELKNSLALGFSDFAVLGRALSALEPVRLALDQAGIPALVAGGRGFFETREVRDLTLWLTVLANPRDEVALAGLLRSPLAGVSDEALLGLCAGRKLADAFEQASDGLAIRARLDRWRPLRDAVSPDRLAAVALDDTDYLAALPPHGCANVEKFLRLLRDLYAARPRTLRETLDELARLRAAAEPEAPPGESSDAVRLMSIHKSKGLEFPVVFVPALDRRTDRSTPVICFDPRAGLGVRWRDPAGPKGIADSVHQRFCAETALRETAEENRLLYVAMTRAKKHVALSYTGHKSSAWVELIRPLPGLDAAGISAIGVEPVAGVETVPDLILSRPEITGQYDSTAPVTSITLFRDCPRRYFLQRYIGWQTAARPAVGHALACPDHELRDLDPTELGRQVHALLAGEEVASPDPEAVELARAFADSELGRRAARASRAGRECAFLFAIDDLILSGRVDLWFEEGGELILVDYKTDRITAAAQERLEPYTLQLRLYALALERLLGRLPDRAYLHLLRTRECVAVDLSPARLQEARTAVGEFRRAQDRLEFPPRVGNSCERCEFFGGLCPAAALPLERGH